MQPLRTWPQPHRADRLLGPSSAPRRRTLAPMPTIDHGKGATLPAEPSGEPADGGVIRYQDASNNPPGLEERAMTEQTQTPWLCPKDGTAMGPMGRRSGAWRCPECKGVFIDTEAMRRGGGQTPKWAPAVTSVLLSLLLTFVVRRLLRRMSKQSQP